MASYSTSERVDWRPWFGWILISSVFSNRVIIHQTVCISNGPLREFLNWQNSRSAAQWGQNRNHAAKNQKIDCFSFQIKLISHYSKLFVDLSMYNVFLLRVNLRSLCLKSGIFHDFGCSVNLMKFYCARTIMKPFYLNLWFLSL